MYSSLDRIDIMIKEGGRNVCVQTDHREAHEILAEPEVSVLFALTRVLNPLRHKGGTEAPIVRYVALNPPPALIARVAALTGAQLEVNGIVQQPNAHGDQATAAELADEAFRALAMRVAEREGIALDEAGLAKLEASAYPPPLPREDDEIGHWMSVVELAAVTGEVLRARMGGRWVQDPKGLATIPFLYAVSDQVMVNPTGKAEKFMEVGERESPRQLLALAAESGTVGDTLMPTLKPADWPGRVHTLCEPMLMKNQGGFDVPLIAYAYDQPSSVALIQKDSKESIDDLRKAAFANIAKEHVAIEEMTVGGLKKMMVISGSFYASEKILDRQFMRSMHARIGSDLLAAGVPGKGLLLVTNGIVAPEIMAQFLAICRGRYEDSPTKISPVPILIQDGEIVGLVQFEKKDPEKKKGFWNRLFN